MINLAFRRELKGDISKALYRFYRGQSGTQNNYHVLTIAKAINMNIEQEMFEIRRQVKRGLGGLKSKGYFEKWQIKNDVIFTEKSRKP